MSEKLKPCPFCGHEHIHWESRAEAYICGQCGASGPFMRGFDKDKGSEAWNLRHVEEDRLTWLLRWLFKLESLSISKRKGGSFYVNAIWDEETENWLRGDSAILEDTIQEVFINASKQGEL